MGTLHGRLQFLLENMAKHNIWPYFQVKMITYSKHDVKYYFASYFEFGNNYFTKKFYINEKNREMSIIYISTCSNSLVFLGYKGWGKIGSTF